jgi:hypothetical protein
MRWPEMRTPCSRSPTGATDSEIITAVAVTAGNVGDATAAPDLLMDVLHDASSEAGLARGEMPWTSTSRA